MQNDTRLKFNAFLAAVAAVNGIDVANAKNYTATPSIQQRLETKMQESSTFLKAINIVGVDEMSGEKLGLGVANTIARRTDTSGSGSRATSDPTGLDALGYACKQTDFDTHLTYAKLDMWAKFPDFQTRIRDAIIQRMALDRITIGWNGTSAAATTNPAANPLLQDVNIGWLQKIRTEAPSKVMSDGASTGTNAIKISPTGAAGSDYVSVDALVFDILNNLVDPWFRTDPQLRVILGTDLMADKYFPLVNSVQPATEQLATDMLISQKRVGGLQAVTVPYFPANALLITRLDNISMYYQNGKRRRNVIDNPSKSRVETYESSNDAYVIEDYGMVALAENITFVA